MQCTSKHISMLALLWSALFVFVVQGLNHTIIKRGVPREQIFKQYGAILAKNKKPTTCEIILIGLYSGYVSANCLDFTKGVSLNYDTIYEVYIYSGDTEYDPKVQRIERKGIHVHPNYDPSTFSYDVAVLTWTEDPSVEIMTFIGQFPYYTESSSYILRTLSSEPETWNVPNQYDMPKEDEDCNLWSGIYAMNKNILVCNRITVSSDTAESCPIPYSALYSAFDNTVGAIALYSHSVVFGDDACSPDARWVNYYSYLYHYEGFAVQVLGRNFSIISTDGESTSQKNGTDLFIKNYPASINFKGKLQLSGDSYARIASIEQSQSAASTDSSDSATDEPTGSSSDSISTMESSTQTSTASHDDTDDASSELSKGAKIGIGVGVSVFALLVIIGLLYFYVRKWRQKKAHKAQTEALRMEEIANELQAELSSSQLPPPYFRVEMPRT